MKTLHGDLDRWPDPASSGARRSVFAQDLVVEGDAYSIGTIEVQGNVIGSLRAPEITVAGSGRVEGSVAAHDLAVLGAVSVTCHWSFIQLRPEPGVHLRLSARVEQSPGARNFHRVQRDVRLRWSGAGRNLRGPGSQGPNGAARCCSR